MCVGLSSEATSDGFVVDTTPPVTSSQMALDSRLGTLKANSQVRPDSLTCTTSLTHRYDQSHRYDQCHSQVRPVSLTDTTNLPDGTMDKITLSPSNLLSNHCLKSSCCRSRSEKDCFHHLTVALHLSLCCKSDVQESIFMSLSFRFLLMVSLNRRRGRPLFL